MGILTILASLLCAVVCVEVDLVGPAIAANQHEWKMVHAWSLPSASSVEVELDIHAYRTGIVGTAFDFFSIRFPSHYRVRLLAGDNSTVLFESAFNRSMSCLSEIVRMPKSSKPIVSLWIQNLNTLFAIQPWIVGEVLSSSDQFDLRTRFPACPFPVYSQLMCGACYADVVAGAGTDDLCIANGGSPVAAKLSPQPIISCSKLGGCAGGSPYLAAEWTSENGLTEAKDCPFQSGRCTPQDDVEKDGCVACDSLKMPWNTVRYRFRPIPLMPASEHAMRKHIESRGSVMVIFLAHTNFQEFFFTHPFGIYKSTEGSPSLGNHAVRMIGFGVDGDTKYWIGVNSWDTSWGNRGTFKILRGSNFCLIEQYPVGIEHLGPITAGLSSNQESIDQRPVEYPQVGEWNPQNPKDKYWENFVEKNRYLIKRELNSEDAMPEKIETKVSHGFHVKLRFPQGVVHIHVSPSGTAEVVAKQKKSPEISSSVLVH